MSKIDALIAKLCPNGVATFPLGEIGETISGLRGKAKSDFTDGNAPYVSYVDISNNPALNFEVQRLVKVDVGEKQNEIRLGDVLITGSSETKVDVGLTSVVTIQPRLKTYINSFCFIWRPKKDIEILPDFSKHLFRGQEFRDKVIETANGVTRQNISKPKLLAIRIPVPPLEIQKEIVAILDKFTELEAELEAELEERKKQYSFYRFKLVDNNKSKTVKLKDITEATFWIMPSTPAYDESEGIAYITSKNLSKGNIDYKGSKRISQKSYDDVTKNRPIKENDLLIGMIGTIGEIARVKKSDLPFYGQNMYLVRFDQKQIDINYFLHYFDSELMKDYFQSVKNNSAQGYLKAEHIEEIQIPLPALIKQREIAGMLDTYSALINDIAIGLPAELIARRQQYEYYRNKLLTFKE